MAACTEQLALNERLRTGLLEEYPFLAAWDIRIERRFQASENRLSNAYLVSTGPQTGEIPCFVAKMGAPQGDSSRGVLAEWHALRLAEACFIPAPALLAKGHQPREFLLLEFLDGMDGQCAIENGVHPDHLFSLVGDVLRQLHEVQTPGFGDLAKPGGGWADTVIQRIEPKVQALGGIVGSELQTDVRARIAESLWALSLEPDESILLHRDAYLSNFMIDDAMGQASIIDFGMACGGRPLYDLAKLYILDLYRFPDSRDAFLGRYFAGATPPASFQDLLKVYLYVELLGMIRFFHADGQASALEHATAVLKELLDGRGRMVDLIAE